MTLAGLDVATRTGLVVFRGDDLLLAEAFRPTGKTNGEINAGFRSWLVSRFAEYQVESAAAEEPLVTDLKDKEGKAIVTVSTYRRIYGLFGVLEELCETEGIPLRTVHQATWRKHFTGSGRAKKEDAVARCKLLGWDISSKDAAEAAGVCSWLRGHLAEQDLFRRAGDAA